MGFSELAMTFYSMTSALFNTPMIHFWGSEKNCEIFKFAATITFQQKAAAGLVLALVRYLYMEKPNLACSLGNLGIFKLAVTAQFFLLSLGLIIKEITNATIGEEFKDTFCQGVSFEFYLTIHKNTGKYV